MEGFFKLLAEREAFHSCQIEGIYPENWTFTDYLRHKCEEEEKERRRLRKLEKKKLGNITKENNF